MEFLTQGEKLKNLRLELNLRQKDLSDEKVTREFISMVEKGKRNFLFLSSLITICFCLIIATIGLVLYSNIANIYGKTLDVNQIADVQKIFPIMLLNIIVNVMAQSVQGIILGYEKFIYNKNFHIS